MIRDTRRVLPRLMSVGLAWLMVVFGVMLVQVRPPAAEATAPGSAAITDAELSWAVAAPERAAGGIDGLVLEPLGETAPAIVDGAAVWDAGAGTARADAMPGELAFARDSGIRLRALPADGGFGLERTLMSPRIDNGAHGSGRLVFDVSGPGLAEDAAPAEVPLADVTFAASTPEADGRRVVLADARLTEEGARALGGVLEPGSALDALELRYRVHEGGAVSATRAETAVVTRLELTSTPAAPKAGEPLDLAATVSPAGVEGNVAFHAGDRLLGESAVDADGVARYRVPAITEGAHEFTAVFAPKDAVAYAGAEATHAVTVGGDAVTEGTITGAKLSWGVKASFRNYIYNFAAFEGRTTMLGNAVQPALKGVYEWPEGRGKIMSDGAKGEIAFGEGNGIHFESHPMQTPAGKAYALDLTFTNPRVSLTSVTTGQLFFDVSGREFKDMGTVGEEFHIEDVLLADLRLPAFTTKEGTGTAVTMVWSEAQATLTSEGARAFGGFYEAGIELDPVTFSLTTELDVTAKKPTQTEISVTPEKIEQGQRVTATAKVTPRIAGEVVFSAGGTSLGAPVTLRGGQASLSTSTLPVGIHSVTATFTPEDPAYGSSYASTQVTVMSQSKPPAPAPAASAGGARAGSLSWPVSSQFVAYTTCEGKERFGMSHCAKGSIVTQGVGAGYLFPQSDGSSWDQAAQTGTVQFSGSVAFHGYGQTMFNVTNPSITVTGPSSATLNTGNSTSYGAASYALDLGSAHKEVGPGGEVTWSGVPVSGVMTSGGGGGQTIGFDPLTFTVGSVSAVSYGNTSAGAATKKKREPAASPPATTGITVLTPAEKITAGGRIELEASGFDKEDTGVLVVLYSDPVVLDREASADKSGKVTWSGSLPKDMSGKHTITFQGSVNAGAVIDILDEKKSKEESAKAKKKAAQERAEIEAEKLAAAGALAQGGIGDWQWWASAAGLVVIAACSTLLAERQRRLAGGTLFSLSPPNR
ncbi:HtaA domain-containing protein [Leucobacter luti]|uniref:HtaA domain-containing protein n=1 Tax=Leucobacter luti TaxID=340320 RepID=UPI003D00A41A